jgi:PAS domain S-box-containing protein
VYWNFVYQPLRGEDGQVTGVTVVATEVTDQMLARQQMQQLNQELEARVRVRTREAEMTRQEVERNRQRLDQAFRQALFYLNLYRGPDHVFKLVHPLTQQLFGERVLPELAEDAHRPFDLAYTTGEPQHHPELLTTIDQTGDGKLREVYFDIMHQPLFDAQGRVEGVLTLSVDATERVRAGRASEAATHRLRLLTDALPVLIGYVDRAQKYRFANQAYQLWFGHEPDHLLGCPVREVVGEAAYQVIKPYIERVLDSGRVDFEATMPYCENFTRHIRSSYVPDVRGGAVVGFYTLTSDISEQVEARQHVDTLNQELAVFNEELLEINTQLTRTNVDLDNFIYTASHDLKAPISNIEGLLLALGHELPSEALVGDVPEILLLMQNATERFKRTITYLTEVSKLQKEHAQPPTQLPLAAVVEEVRLDLPPLVQQTQAQLVVDVPPTAHLPFSKKNLRSVVYNLLSNALKYHHPGRTHGRCKY